MKKIALSVPFLFIAFGIFACKNTYYVHHTVRMVDAKSYLDHPVSTSLFYR